MLNLTDEKKMFFKTVLLLVIPMAIQNLINVGVQSADVVMLGKLGEVTISGASLAGNVFFIMSLFLFGLTSGAAVLTAQYWGKGDKKTIEKVLALSLEIGVSVGVLFTLAAFFFPVQIMHIFSNEDEVIALGAQYLKIVAFTFVPSAITVVYLNVIRSVEKVLISTVIYAISLVINVVLNAILIFGMFGAPALGIRGAAFATLSARLAELAIALFYAIKINDVVKIRPRYFFNTDKVLIKDFSKYAAPVTLNEIMWGSGVSVISGIVGHLGSAAVAANSVTGIVRQLAMVATFGLANATAIMLGKTIGENKIELTKTYASRFVKMTLILGVLGGLLIACISNPICNFMGLGTESTEILKMMLTVMCFFVFTQGLNTTLIVGVFRSGGDTKFGLYADCGGLWCCAITFGWIAAFILKLPITYVYILLCSDELIKMPFTISRYKSYKWLKNITREFE